MQTDFWTPLSFCALLLFLPLVPLTAEAQTVSVENGATVQVQNGADWNLEDGTMDFGPAGSTARLDEHGTAGVTGGRLTAIRALSNPSSADPAGLGLVISASVDFGDVTVTRGHTAQSASNGNVSIERYYDVTPSQNNSGLNADLTVPYREAELNGIGESELEFFRSDDGGTSWSEEGYSNRDGTANTVTLNGVESFSRWTLGGESSPLPVELARFEGTTTDEGARLTWQTASETNNAGFTVQRRAGTSDAEWTDVGFVESTAAGGTTEEPQSYRFEDADLPYAADTLAYRLRQVDVDGTETPSDPIRVGRTVEAVALLGTYPNPARQRATVRYALPTRQEVEVRLYDVLGRQVRAVVSDQQEGRHKQTLDVSDLSNGVYFLQLQAGGTTKTQKLTVVR